MKYALLRIAVPWSWIRAWSWGYSAALVDVTHLHKIKKLIFIKVLQFFFSFTIFFTYIINNTIYSSKRVLLDHYALIKVIELLIFDSEGWITRHSKCTRSLWSFQRRVSFWFFLANFAIIYFFIILIFFWYFVNFLISFFVILLSFIF